MKIEITKLSEAEIFQRGIEKWPVWTKEISEFDWSYTSSEQCLILEGRAEIKSDFENVVIEKGDYVVFPKGLVCKWKITDPIRKYYNFD